jgi:hypothetical protein
MLAILRISYQRVYHAFVNRIIVARRGHFEHRQESDFGTGKGSLFHNGIVELRRKPALADGVFA